MPPRKRKPVATKLKPIDESPTKEEDEEDETVADCRKQDIRSTDTVQEMEAAISRIEAEGESPVGLLPRVVLNPCTPCAFSTRSEQPLPRHHGSG